MIQKPGTPPAAKWTGAGKQGGTLTPILYVWHVCYPQTKISAAQAAIGL